MSIRYYDIAVAEKINDWLPKSNNRRIQVLKPDEISRLFTIEADEKNDNPITLPLVAISRETQIDIKQPTMTPMSYDGLTLQATEKQSIQLNAIPINVTYQLDIFTRRFDEGDDLLREFIFKLINNPKLYIELPYNNLKFKHIATIKLHPEAEDTSDIDRRLFPGQFTRWTLHFDLDGAYLFSLPIVDNVEVEYDLKVKDRETQKIINEEV